MRVKIMLESLLKEWRCRSTGLCKDQWRDREFTVRKGRVSGLNCLPPESALPEPGVARTYRAAVGLASRHRSRLGLVFD